MPTTVEFVARGSVSPFELNDTPWNDFSTGIHRVLWDFAGASDSRQRTEHSAQRRGHMGGGAGSFCLL